MKITPSRSSRSGISTAPRRSRGKHPGSPGRSGDGSTDRAQASRATCERPTPRPATTRTPPRLSRRHSPTSSRRSASAASSSEREGGHPSPAKGPATLSGTRERLVWSSSSQVLDNTQQQPQTTIKTDDERLLTATATVRTTGTGGTPATTYRCNDCTVRRDHCDRMRRQGRNGEGGRTASQRPPLVRDGIVR